jgi:hypothetical protein
MSHPFSIVNMHASNLDRATMEVNINRMSLHAAIKTDTCISEQDSSKPDNLMQISLCSDLVEAAMPISEHTREAGIVLKLPNEPQSMGTSHAGQTDRQTDRQTALLLVLSIPRR